MIPLREDDGPALSNGREVRPPQRIVKIRATLHPKKHHSKVSDLITMSCDVKVNSELAERPGFLVRRLHQIYVSIYLDSCRDFETTPVQSSVMQVLRAQPGLDQTSIAAEIGMDRTTTSNVLARLTARGIVRREIHGPDRRSKRAYLTEAGSTMIIQMQEAIDAAHRRLVAPLDEADRAVFLAQMRHLVEANNQHGRTALRHF